MSMSISKIENLRKIILFSVTISIMIVVITIYYQGLKVYGDENDDMESMVGSTVDQNFYSYTNNYNCKDFSNTNNLIEQINGETKYLIEYNLSNQINDCEISEISQFTILTPGLGAQAYQWGRVDDVDNDGEIANNADIKTLGYYESSIITKLFQIQNSNVLFINTYTDDGSNHIYGKDVNSYDEIDITTIDKLKTLKYDIYDITAQVEQSIYNDTDGVPYDLSTPINIADLDFSKHSIIIFNGHTVNSKNYIAYIEFNYVISSLVKLYRDDKNELPRLNLIGHSRGGLTNLQYALDHPDLVANLFSIATPYCGSISAELDLICKLLTDGSSDGQKDIVDPAIYREYMNRWNENYNTLYDSINVYALGGYSTLTLFHDILADEKTTIVDKVKDKVLYGMLINAFGSVWTLTDSFPSLKTSLVGGVTDKLYEFYGSEMTTTYEEIEEVVERLLSDIEYDTVTGQTVWKNDGFVNLSSQLGRADNLPTVPGIINYAEYVGFIREVKLFDCENSNLDATAEYNVPILHNLESRDDDIINYIIRVLKKGLLEHSVFVKDVMSNSETAIIEYINASNLPIVDVPSVIDGKTVRKIGRGAFSNLDEITEVIIPKEIVEIDDNAFLGCSNLEKVTFEEGSNITSIGDYAFSGCFNLKEINLPNSIVTIGKFAFSGCTSLTDIVLPSGISTIDTGLFANCCNLSNIIFSPSITTIRDAAFKACVNLKSIVLPPSISTISTDAFFECSLSNIIINGVSNLYTIYDDGLYNINKSKIYYYFGDASVYEFPDETTTVENNAFYGNSNIELIDFNNVINIGKNAFSNCANLDDIVNYDNVIRADKTSFIGTKWYDDNSSPIIILGKAFVKYESTNSDNSFYIPDNIEYIGEFAVTSEYLEEVYVPSSVTKIADNAFSLAVNVKDVYILKTTPPIINENSFPMFVENIYVPKYYVNTYEQDAMYHDYLGIIKSKVVKVNFYYSNGEFFRTQQIEYYKTLEELYEFYTADSGMYFVGWSMDSTGEGKIYQNGSLFDIYEDEINMYPIFKGLNVKITLEGMLESSTENVEYGENVVLEAPTLDGYAFVGWYSMPNGGGIQYTSSDGIITNWPTVDTEIILYAHYEAIVYTITYSIDGIPYVDTDITQYTIEDIIKLPLPTNFGYRFSGWMNGNEEVSTIYKGTTGHLNLSGSWIGTEYNCTFVGGTIDISDDVKIINLDGLQTNEMLFTIKNTATMVTFISSDATKIYNMSIEIENRNADLVINLKNVNFVAPTNKNGITANVGEYTLIINCNGTNSIVGGQGSPTQFENVADGMCGILANRLVLDGSFIAITGGNGNHGADSIEEDGEVIVHAGNGGHGGYAVYVLSTLNPKLSEMVLTGGTGGNGGDAINGDAGYAGLGQQACNFDHSYGEKGGAGIPGTSVNGSNGGFNGAEENEMESVTILNLNCHQKVSYDTEIVSKMQTITYNLNIGCLNVYYITISSLAEVTFAIYNSEKEIVFGPIVKAANEESIIQNTSLESGWYTIEVTNNSQTASSITTHVRAASSSAVSLQLSTRTDAFEHLHNGFNEYIFYSEIGGFYNLELDAYEVIPKNAVSIKYYDTVIEKIANLDIDYYASNIYGASNITFYYPGNVTYFIEINVNKINSNSGTLTSLFLTLDKIDAVESLNEEDDYTKMLEINRGDLIESLIIPTRGLYEIVLEHDLSLTSKVTLVVTKENDESPNGFDIIVLKDINALTSRISSVFSTDSNTVLHFGYLNSYGEGEIEFNIERLIVNNFTIITDPNDSAGCGSEVRINGGQYNGTDMTVGYTRICYLGTDAPDTSSRLKYDWYSTDPNVAEISSYGTITAVSAGTTTIKAIYKDYPAIYGEITIVVGDYGEMNTVYLKYGMDIRTGGTVSGTEVTSGKGSVINVGESPVVTIHTGYTRLICLGNDSPTSSIQDFSWTSYQEFDTDEGIATVSKYGTITGRYVGSLTVKGVYKYNPNYVVYIRITVI